jgi:hypothetical protein
MNYAELAKQNRNNALEAQKALIRPDFDAIMGEVIERFKTSGEVELRDTGISIWGDGYPCKVIRKIRLADRMEALAQMIEEQGFKVSRWWWGYSTYGDPNGIKIRLA